MNQRINELSDQAWRFTADEVSYLGRVHNRAISQDELQDIFELRFAQLIVQECAAFIDNAISNGGVDGRSLKEHFEIAEPGR